MSKVVVVVLAQIVLHMRCDCFVYMQYHMNENDVGVGDLDRKEDVMRLLHCYRMKVYSTG